MNAIFRVSYVTFANNNDVYATIHDAHLFTQLLRRYLYVWTSTPICVLGGRSNIPGFGTCPQLRSLEETEGINCHAPSSAAPDHCATIARHVHTSCRTLETCDQAVIVAGAWNRCASLMVPFSVNLFELNDSFLRELWRRGDTLNSWLRSLKANSTYVNDCGLYETLNDNYPVRFSLICMLSSAGWRHDCITATACTPCTGCSRIKALQMPTSKSSMAMVHQESLKVRLLLGVPDWDSSYEATYTCVHIVYIWMCAIQKAHCSP